MKHAKRITVNGVTKTLAQWSSETGIHRRTLSERLLRGMPAHLALRRERSYRGFESELWAGANTLPYDVDLVAQTIVHHTGGMTLDEVGTCLGLTRERVRQIEDRALRQLRAEAKRIGLEQPMREWLADLAQADRERTADLRQGYAHDARNRSGRRS